jgi:hypothetical protein
MAIENVELKLQEVRSFLDKMRDQEQKAFGDKEPFDHYLSAFLNAARTVDYRLRHECKATYPAWRKAWNAKHPSEDNLIKCMVGKRRNEIHEGGSGRIVKTKEIKVGVGGSYSDKSGTLEVMGCPSPLLSENTGATVYVPQYFFVIDGVERLVTVVCAEYLALLEQMVAQYKTDTSMLVGGY